MKGLKAERLGVIDNDGVMQYLTKQEWADHPDTYSLDKDGEKRHITVDQIRHRGYVKDERQYTDRQEVGLESVEYLRCKPRPKKPKTEGLPILAEFLRRRLVT